jgi:hypothetical protein
LTDLFYDSGYNPRTDSALGFIFTDLIRQNVDSTYRDLYFGIETWDIYDGELQLVDADLEIQVQDFATPGQLVDTNVIFSESISNTSVTMTVEFTIDH